MRPGYTQRNASKDAEMSIHGWCNQLRGCELVPKTALHHPCQLFKLARLRAGVGRGSQSLGQNCPFLGERQSMVNTRPGHRGLGSEGCKPLEEMQILDSRRTHVSGFRNRSRSPGLALMASLSCASPDSIADRRGKRPLRTSTMADSCGDG